MRKIVSLILKLIVVVSSVWGITLAAMAPEGATCFLYFTIQSNIWIAVTELVGFVLLLANVRITRTLSLLKYIFTISITLTGLVYCFMLAPYIPEGAFALSSSLVHVIAPIAAVIDFIVCGYHISRRKTFWCLVPPLYYLCFATVGYFLNWQFAPGQNYPYYFMNWGSPAGAFGFEFPNIGVVWYVLFLVVALSAIGRLFIAISNKVYERD